MNIDKKYLIDFNSLKVGDKLFDILQGVCTVRSIDEPHPDYKISCLVDNTDNKITYTIDGKYHTYHRYPRLFKSNPYESLNNTSEYPKVMMVSGNIGIWRKRVVIAKVRDLYIAWENVETIEDSIEATNVVTWKYAKDIEPVNPTVELTLEQIAKLANCDVKNLKIVKEQL